ncbi:hypothetical protein BDV39DRAFT_202062 [Aspergillus sergii]|uniref:Uncharacterized protein n=1 Tax=Aspergillus sergii TaxID=1034303 RepID=A0A5N6XD15_9EURO|nr:hypothetical protein BDV39DRAFT_202062 [Aspergillus sergii]
MRSILAEGFMVAVETASSIGFLILGTKSGPAIVTIENFRVLGLDPEDEDFYLNYPPERRKMTRRKVCILSDGVRHRSERRELQCRPWAIIDLALAGEEMVPPRELIFLKVSSRGSELECAN